MVVLPANHFSFQGFSSSIYRLFLLPIKIKRLVYLMFTEGYFNVGIMALSIYDRRSNDELR